MNTTIDLAELIGDEAYELVLEAKHLFALEDQVKWTDSSGTWSLVIRWLSGVRD